MTWSCFSSPKPLALCTLALASAAPAQDVQGKSGGIQLDLPILCDMARDCSIQKYVDRADGPGRRDYRCGTLTTEGHNGTDFRLRRFQDFGRQVKVVAAAAGTVLRVRDDMPDVSAGLSKTPLPPNRWAGNAVILRHSNGWETQYSHLRLGSVRVRPGQRIGVGEELGTIGLSGNTEYPHLHFEVRRGGKAIDPFATDPLAACGAQQPSLWTAKAVRASAYRATLVLAVDFASSPADARVSFQTLTPLGDMNNPAALILWANVSGTRAGDIESFRIDNPNGSVVAARQRPISRDNLVWLGFTGVPRPAAGWARGKYNGTYTLTRNGVLVGRATIARYIT